MGCECSTIRLPPPAFEFPAASFSRKTAAELFQQRRLYDSGLIVCRRLLQGTTLENVFLLCLCPVHQPSGQKSFFVTSQRVLSRDCINSALQHHRLHIFIPLICFRTNCAIFFHVFMNHLYVLFCMCIFKLSILCHET